MQFPPPSPRMVVFMKIQWEKKRAIGDYTFDSGVFVIPSL